MMELTLLLSLLLFLLLCSAFFSCSEASLFSLSATRVKVYQGSSDSRKKLIANLLMHPRDLLVTIFILNTLANILIQNVAANLFGDFSSWVFTVGVPLILTLVFGEIIPKYLGLQNNSSFAYKIAPIIAFFQRLLKPIQQMVVAITHPLSRLMFFFLKKEEPLSEEEIQHILKTSEQHGVFNAEEGELITGYLELQDASVKELMWPREDIIYYNLQEPLTKLIYLFADQEVTRIPVCDPDLDAVKGVISASHYFLHRDQIHSSHDLLPLLAKPFYVPETMSARLLLRRFHEQGEILALVVDEYGSISGLITREDLFEVVIGEIKDLRNQKELYSCPGENEVIASGKLELDAFNALFKVNLTSPNNMITIGGWLMERLGEIPRAGSQYELDHFLFKILSATPNRIRRLYIRKLQ